MKTHIVRIGNSQGLRIPKPLLDQSGLHGEVELEAQDQRIIIRSTERLRQGWDQAFHALAEAGDDRLLDDAAMSLTT